MHINKFILTDSSPFHITLEKNWRLLSENIVADSPLYN